MSRPFTEVILLDRIRFFPNNSVGVEDSSDYSGSIKLNEDKIHKIWGGSKQDFIKLFDLPIDTPLESDRVEQIYNNKTATINFKCNLQIWYYVNGAGYVPGSNLTMDITIPNFIIFKHDGNAVIVGSGSNVYNPNLFPIIPTVNSFPSSNKNPDIYDGSSYGGFGNSTPYILFRYGINGEDIQICLISRNSNNVNLNSNSFLIPYFSMTFTGFNKIKRLK